MHNSPKSTLRLVLNAGILQPMGEGTQGAVAGEVLGSGALGWLRERTSSECPPGARPCAGPQNTVDSVQ
jgi:hypothetical protein